MNVGRGLSLRFLLLIALFASVRPLLAQAPCGPTIMPPAALSVDWSQYHFDAAHTGCNPYEKALSPATVGKLTSDWQFTLAYGSSVAGGLVYAAGTANTLYALNAITGAVQWSYMPGDGSWGEAAAVANGVVYLGYDDGPHGMGASGMYAFDARTGFLLWRCPCAGAVSPTVANGKVYFGESNYLIALNAGTGTILWRYAVGDDIASPPAVVNGRVYVGSIDKNIYALDATTGALLWRYATAGYVASSPAVAGGVVYIYSAGDGLYALDAVTGALRWKDSDGTVRPTEYLGWYSPVVANGEVYFGFSDGNVRALNAGTGALIWQYQVGMIGASLAVANNVVYVSNTNGLYALEARTGTFLWGYNGAYYNPSLAIANGKLYVGATSGLYVFHLPEQ